MVKSSKMDLNKMIKYLSFIDGCKNKSYNLDTVIHKHHIFPKCIYGPTDDLVLLSVDDHIKAHLLLSECFDEGSEEQIHNLRSARILGSKSIKSTELLTKISESYKGNNNPFWNKKHSEQVICYLKHTSGDRTRNKTYDELYGSNAKCEKQKRSEGVKKVHQNRTAEEKEHIAKKMSENSVRRTGALNPASKSIEVDGVKYESLISAIKSLNITKYKLTKLPTFKYL